jgi:hypothetical protein
MYVILVTVIRCVKWGEPSGRMVVEYGEASCGVVLGCGEASCGVVLGCGEALGGPCPSNITKYTLPSKCYICVSTQ